MLNTERIESAWQAMVALERDVKAHIDRSHDDVTEQRRCLMVYRHAHALRGALEQLSEARKQAV